MKASSLKKAFTLAITFIFIGTLPIVAQIGGRGPGKNTTKRLADLSHEEALTRVQAFRDYRGSGDYLLQFDLIVSGKNQSKKIYHGMLAGTWTHLGPLSRADLWQDGINQEHAEHFLFLGGHHPQAWVVHPTGTTEAQLIPTEDFNLPLLPELPYTIYDFLMPFMYWDHLDYQGHKQIKGRPAYLFRMHPPTAYQQFISYVDVALDASYNALIKTTTFDQNKKAETTSELISFKKIDSEWMVKTLDFTHEKKKTKVRFELKAAAMRLDLQPDLFEPASLHQTIVVPYTISLTYF